MAAQQLSQRLGPQPAQRVRVAVDEANDVRLRQQPYQLRLAILLLLRCRLATAAAANGVKDGEAMDDVAREGGGRPVERVLRRQEAVAVVVVVGVVVVTRTSQTAVMAVRSSSGKVRAAFR